MDFAPEKYQKDLDRIKKNIRESYQYFQPNYERFNSFRKMVFESSLTNEDKQLLQALNRPVLEFNILEAYISRLLGEIYKQKPAVRVEATNEENANPATIKFLEQHLRSVFDDRTNKHKIYEISKDILSGGFSAAEVYTDYTSEMSMQQMINFDRAFDPTLCGWDPVSRYSHKGDGQYCFKLVPKTKAEVKELYPKLDVDRFTYSKNFENFKWSYKSGPDEMILIVDYYEKKKRRKKIVQLSDGRIIFKDEWKREKEEWENYFLRFENIQPILPPVVVKERMTVITQIVRYQLCESKILSYEETDYNMLPIIFIDGNSILVRETKGGQLQQVTRPYVYQAAGAQRLKNISGIALANEIESTVQHKFMMKAEAMPDDPSLLDAWTNYSEAKLMVYNGYLDNDPDRPIDNPVSPVPRVGAPQEIAQAFMGAESLVQNILGSYDSSLGINNNQLSGRAIQEGAKQANAAAMPYIAGLMHGIQRIAQVYTSLVPKYYRTPVTLPYIDDAGNHKYMRIDKTNDILNYDANVLNVSVEAGPSFRVQKEHTLMMVKELMGVSELFAKFVNDKGLDFILDNMEGYGIDQLKSMVDQWTKEQQLKAAQEPNPEAMQAQLAQEKLMLDKEKLQLEHSIDMMKLQQEEQKQKTDMVIAADRNQTELQRQQDKQALEEMKIQLEHYKAQMEERFKHLELIKTLDKESRDEQKD